MDSTVLTVFLAAIAFISATPLIRRQRKKASIDFAQSALALSQAELQTEQRARLAQERRCDEKIAEQDRRHAREIGELSGRVSVLTDAFAQVIADKVAEMVGRRDE